MELAQLEVHAASKEKQSMQHRQSATKTAEHSAAQRLSSAQNALNKNKANLAESAKEAQKLKGLDLKQLLASANDVLSSPVP